MKTEKRYTLNYKNHDGSCVILDNGKRLSSDEILDLLNAQDEPEFYMEPDINPSFAVAHSATAGTELLRAKKHN